MKIFISAFEGKKRGVGDCPEGTVPILYRNNATLIFCNLLESRLSEIEVLKW
jgi:hypothetical protein